MGFSLTIDIAFELFRQILQKKEIEMAKNKAELALYRAQINPHFLFNTLNTLYALVLTQSENTESAFIKLSDILKYMYTNATEEFIPLGNETKYIDLQKLRLNYHTKVIYEEQTANISMIFHPDAFNCVHRKCF